MYFIDKYDHWSRYEPEEKGVMIAYASMYGNTEAAAQALAGKLCEKGVSNVWLYDVSNTHVSQLISETFRLSHIVLASVTYNLGIYPVMHNYLMDMKLSLIHIFPHIIPLTCTVYFHIWMSSSL